ncbi:MAG: UbiA family prenyltransferase [bacterium]|nr:UbiA family prenyltransferase [bacterium]
MMLSKHPVNGPDRPTRRVNSRIMIRGMLDLIRWFSLSGMALLALVSLRLAGHSPSSAWSIYFVSGIIVVAAAGYVWNDYLDYRIDAINKPSRPLVQGLISLRFARTIAILLGAIGLVLYVQLGIFFFLYSLFVVVVLAFYSRALKDRHGVIGNLAVALLLASIPLTVGAKHGWTLPLAVLAGVTFCLGFAHEVMKDAEDVPGDRRGGRKTLATHYSRLALEGAISTSLAFTLAIGLVPLALGSAQSKLLVIPETMLVASFVFWKFGGMRDAVFRHLLKLNAFAYVIAYFIAGG